VRREPCGNIQSFLEGAASLKEPSPHPFCIVLLLHRAPLVAGWHSYSLEIALGHERCGTLELLWSGFPQTAMLRLDWIETIPSETVRIAQLALEENNRCRKLREQFGTVFSDDGFAALFPRAANPLRRPGD
jgi:hypothetical protein